MLYILKHIIKDFQAKQFSQVREIYIKNSSVNNIFKQNVWTSNYLKSLQILHPGSHTLVGGVS